MSGNHLICVEDFEEVARQKLPGAVYGYYSKGVRPLEQTIKESRKAYTRYRLRPRIFCNPFKKNLSTTVLGHHVNIPIGISPTALQMFAHNEKEKGTIKAAHSHGTLMVLSSIANTHITELHKEASNGLLWMQTYFFKTSALTKALIRRAERAGFKALVVTIDSPGLQVRYSKTYSSMTTVNYMAARTGLKPVNLDVVVDENRDVYEHLKQENSNMWNYSIHEVNASHATVDDIVWLKSFTRLPIVLKGVLSVATARKAMNLGVDGILVSAHGGRQLDGVPAPIDALPEIVEAVRGSGVEVYLDGGIRTGTDVLKALALGARAVFIGRPVLWGLAADGSRGVSQVLQILTEELDLAMTLSGVKDVRNVSRSVVVHESEYLASKL